MTEEEVDLLKSIDHKLFIIGMINLVMLVLLLIFIMISLNILLLSQL